MNGVIVEIRAYKFLILNLSVNLFNFQIFGRPAQEYWFSVIDLTQIYFEKYPCKPKITL